MNTHAFRPALMRTLGVALALASAWASAQSIYRLTDLSALVGQQTFATDMNASGQVSGVYVAAGNVEHAFLWDGNTIQDLGTLGGTATAGHAIGDSGHVTGRSRTTGNAASHAFLWDGATMQDLGTLGGTDSEGSDVNASGQVTGFADIAGNAASHAFLWDSSTLQDLGTLGGASSRGVAINVSGQVTGWAQIAGNVEHAFLWNSSTMQDLGTLGGTISFGEAINDSGLVTGYARTTGDAAEHAFLWDGSTLQDIGTPGFDSIGIDINASGQVVGLDAVGFRGAVGTMVRHAFLWDGSTLQDLGTLGGSSSGAVAINNFGQVTGGADTAGNAASHAFLWSGGILYDLNALIDPADPLQPYVTLNFGADINDLGQILAEGCDSRTGECGRAYLATVVSTLDTTPDAFSFTSQIGVASSAVITSNAVTITGIETPAGIIVANGEYSIGCSDTFTSSNGMISDGQTVCVRHTSSASSDTAQVTTLTVGGVSGTFTSTTADTTPDAFSFTNQTGVATSAVITSNAITISGIEAPAQISVAGGEYSIGCGGTFTSSNGTISDGQTVCVRHTSSASSNTAQVTTLAVGGVSGTFTSTTKAAPPPSRGGGGGGAMGFSTLLPLLLLLRRRRDLPRA